MKTKTIGAGIFLTVVVFVVIFVVMRQAETPEVSVTGYVGGEKMGFLEDEKVISILQRKYKVIMDYKKMGSLDMARADVSGMDFIFPSSSLAAELYRLNGGCGRAGFIWTNLRLFNRPCSLKFRKSLYRSYRDNVKRRQYGKKKRSPRYNGTAE